jgi:hypothetical protein
MDFARNPAGRFEKLAQIQAPKQPARGNNRLAGNLEGFVLEVKQIESEKRSDGIDRAV